MRWKAIAGSIGGAVAIYIAMAACGGGGNNGGVLDAGGIADAIIDVLHDALDPVPDAHADADAGCCTAPAPIVATEPCTTPGEFGSGTATYAVHNFPGKSIQELAMVRAVLTNPTLTDLPYGSVDGGATFRSQSVGGVLIANGSVAVMCGGALTVTFVLP